MVIRNLSKQYRVIREWAGEGEIRQYICREENDQKDYCITRQDLKRVSGSEIRFFMEQLQNESFLDFIDYFTDAESLYLVMAHPVGIPLTKKLQEFNNLKERMEIGKNLLEHMVLLNLPPFFFKAAMNPELITVSPSLEIGLGYDLSCLGVLEEDSFNEGCILLGKILGELYKEELSIRAFPPMDAFIYDLEDRKFSCILEVYQRFQGIYGEWVDKKTEELKPESLAFRLWARMKKLGNFLRKLTFVAILILAAAYTVFSFVAAFRVPASSDTYSTIGTLRIQGAVKDEILPSAEAESMGE